MIFNIILFHNIYILYISLYFYIELEKLIS